MKRQKEEEEEEEEEEEYFRDYSNGVKKEKIVVEVNESRRGEKEGKRAGGAEKRSKSIFVSV